MYCPSVFAEERSEVLHAAIRAHPLATLVTHGAAGLTANLVPFTLVELEDGGACLRAHLARANPQVAELRLGSEVLVIFQGPAAYVSPSWYPSKQEHGKVVPTWNYMVVQARGCAAVIDEADWLRRQVDHLTRSQEQDREQPWSLEDAPEAYLAGQLKGIVGVEIPVERLEGKWKVSQNQPPANRSGVVAGMTADGHAAMAALVAGREVT
ncbi:FMN-binding negative transcriptional regulator [Novosphingobium soli]|uniref:FMN-binding negative transcriptional regulator n=1 Tax=Novosphingobium soli TaxID=574956 RepID=A0ABV6CQ04_9SPHN